MAKKRKRRTKEQIRQDENTAFMGKTIGIGLCLAIIAALLQVVAFLIPFIILLGLIFFYIYNKLEYKTIEDPSYIVQARSSLLSLFVFIGVITYFCYSSEVLNIQHYNNYDQFITWVVNTKNTISNDWINFFFDFKSELGLMKLEMLKIIGISSISAIISYFLGTLIFGSSID